MTPTPEAITEAVHLADYAAEVTYYGFALGCTLAESTQAERDAFRSILDRATWSRCAPTEPCDDCGRTDGTHNPEVEH